MPTNRNPMLVNSFEYQIMRMVRMFIMWLSTYILIHLTLRSNLKLKQDLDMKNRIVSIFHGLASFGLSLYYIIVKDFDLETPMDYFASGIICLSFSYFLYDLVACLFYGLWDVKLVIHHLLCVFGSLALLVYKRGFFVVVAGLMLAEASNLPMHVRCICRNFGMKHTKICEYSETLYMIIYILFRGVFAPILLIMSFFSPSCPLFISIVLLGLLVQSFFFIRTMIQIMKKKKRNAQERADKKVPLFWFEVNPDIYTLDYTKSGKKDNIF